MNDGSCSVDRATQAQIDRLVAGELADHERRGLLVWLDEDVSRWRACAIAFLEAQMWEAAAAGISTEESPTVTASGRWNSRETVPQQGERPATNLVSKRQVHRRLYALATAACLALAFTGGYFSSKLSTKLKDRTLPRIVQQAIPDKEPSPAVTTQPLVATVAGRANLDPNISAQLQLPVAAIANEETPESSISDYDRKQWERKGFELIEERRYLPAHLPDGREISVPVKKVHVKVKTPSMS